jgi:hypothetical protein
MIKNIIFILVIIVIWLAFVYEEKGPEDPFATFDNPSSQDFSFLDFECEGKKDCSEMFSCEEAKFYMRKCPGTNLDPDLDGIPCEDLCTGD